MVPNFFPRAEASRSIAASGGDSAGENICELLTSMEEDQLGQNGTSSSKSGRRRVAAAFPNLGCNRSRSCLHERTVGAKKVLSSCIESA
jgi:hypothetical protein